MARFSKHLAAELRRFYSPGTPVSTYTKFGIIWASAYVLAAWALWKISVPTLNRSPSIKKKVLLFIISLLVTIRVNITKLF